MHEILRTVVTVRVHYPETDVHLVLHSDADWNVAIEPRAVTDNGRCAEFELTLDRPYSYFKPVLVVAGATHWARGTNYLIFAHEQEPRDIYPYFHDKSGCTVCALEELETADGKERYAYRVFAPPGYQENSLKRYPVLYLQDGQNVFFPDNSPSGADWRIRQTLSVLDAMNVIDKIIAVGVYPSERERDYTLPGYHSYGKFLAEVLKPRIDTDWRTLDGPEHTAVLGSSLGGVVSLYLAWQWPEVFGMAGCMSSTWGWRDDLQTRISTEPKRPVRIYLDSGWPQDNYEVTGDMRALLLARGYQEGHDLLYFVFPGAHHNEQAWALRSHLPFQFFFGRQAKRLLA